MFSIAPGKAVVGRLRLKPGTERPPDLHRQAAKTRAYHSIIGSVRKRVLLQVLQGTSDSNIRFDDLRSLLGALGFNKRTKGSHHIFTRADVAEILNLRSRGSLSKGLPSEASPSCYHPV